MRALLSRQNAAVLAVLFVVGCATKPASVKEEVSVWLSESPRAIAINVERELPSASIRTRDYRAGERRSEEHTSELQSLRHLVCRLLLEKKKKKKEKNKKKKNEKNIKSKIKL